MKLDRYQCAEIAHLIYADPDEAYRRLIRAANSPIDGYLCCVCGAEIPGPVTELIEHGAREHGLEFDARTPIAKEA